MNLPDNFLSIHANDTECYCQPGFTCHVCSRRNYKEALEREESDDTIYKFLLCVKGDVPYANPTHGAYSKYEGYTVTRYCTHRTLNNEIMEFNKMGGKVTGIECEVATKICPQCESTVSFNFYNFEHDMCNDCLEKNADSFVDKVNECIQDELLMKFLSYKPKFNKH